MTRTNRAGYGLRRSSGDAPLGCIIPFVLLWLAGVALSLSLTGALIYLVVKLAQSL